MNYLALLLQSTVTAPPAQEAATQVAQQAVPTAGGAGGLIITVGYLVIIFGVMWLLIIRPQKKREKQHQEMVSNIGTGDSVVTNTGFYGKVVDVTEGCFIIEFGTNRGIRIPVEKSEVAGIKTPNLTVKRYDTPAVEDKQEDKN